MVQFVQVQLTLFLNLPPHFSNSSPVTSSTIRRVHLRKCMSVSDIWCSRTHHAFYWFKVKYKQQYHIACNDAKGLWGYVASIPLDYSGCHDLRNKG